MSTPYTSASSESVPPSGDSLIDGLVSGMRWSVGSLTYSFPGYASSWASNYGYGEPFSADFAPLSAANQVAVRSALGAWAATMQLTFVESVDSATTVGDLRFAYTYTPQIAGLAAYARAPGSAPAAGDVWFNARDTSYVNVEAAWAPGSKAFQTALHEIGHALGLKHPFEDPNAFLPAYDSRSYTVMSYSARPGDPNTRFDFEPTTPMVLDIRAIQYLYGANTTYNAGNTTYAFKEIENNNYVRYHQTLWDAGGIDTIVWEASYSGALIDLRSGVGGGSRIGGVPVHVLDKQTGAALYSVDNVWIADGTVIENATGGAGNDTIVGNAANNVVDGRAGLDTMSYENATAAVNVDLAITAPQATGYGLDTLLRVENLIGSRFADRLTGSAGANRLDGGAGADTMIGGAGNDVYGVDTAGDTIVEAASGGTDTVISRVTRSLGPDLENLVLGGSASVNGTGNASANTITGNAGNNLLDGGAGTDTVSYAAAAAGVTVDLAITGAQQTGSGNDTLLRFENLVGSRFADELRGTAGSNRIDGGAGSDVMAGRGGNDVYLVDSAFDFVLEAANGGIDTVQSRLVATTLAAHVENLVLIPVGSLFDKTYGTGNELDNIITGNEQSNVLDGAGGTNTVSFRNSGTGVTVDLVLGTATGAGTDTLKNFRNILGSDHDDTLTGDSATNTMAGGAGLNLMNGGSGVDTASYADAPVGVRVTLPGTTSTYQITGYGIDRLIAFENITGSRYDDTLTGNAGANVLAGGSGTNVLDGAGGIDTVSYAAAAVGVNVNLSYFGPQATGASTDSLVNVENLVGSAFGDVLFGNGGSNRLEGGAGADVIDGVAGADVMLGGAGDDTFFVDTTADITIEAAGQGIDTLVTSVSRTLGAEIENMILGGVSSINGTGNALDNTITGNSAGNVMAGGSGIDTLSYRNAFAGVTVDLARTDAQATGGAGVDRISGFENLVGSDHADSLRGSSGANRLAGGLGVDTLLGGAGSDVFVFDAVPQGDRVLDFARGVDLILLAMSSLKIGDGDTVVESAVKTAAPGQASGASELVLCTADVASISSASAAAAVGSATSAFALGRTALIVVDDGIDTGLFIFKSSDGNALVAASELTLLATLQATSSTEISDYAFA